MKLTKARLKQIIQEELIREANRLPKLPNTTSKEFTSQQGGKRFRRWTGHYGNTGLPTSHYLSSPGVETGTSLLTVVVFRNGEPESIHDNFPAYYMQKIRNIGPGGSGRTKKDQEGATEILAALGVDDINDLWYDSEINPGWEKVNIKPIGALNKDNFDESVPRHDFNALMAPQGPRGGKLAGGPEIELYDDGE